MKVNREYSPTHLILETADERDHFWEMVERVLEHDRVHNFLNLSYRNMLCDISNEFSEGREDLEPK